MRDPLRVVTGAGTAGESAGESAAEGTRPRPLPSAVYTADEVAALLAVSRRCLERWVSAGRLPPGARLALPGRTVRFSRAVIDQWIAAGCPRPDGRRR
jgi:excisionase family DNA binding protein